MLNKFFFFSKHEILTFSQAGRSERKAEKCYHLPDSLVLEIFSYLDIEDRIRLSRACQQWRRVSLDPSLWESINLFNCQRAQIRDKTVISLICRISSALVTHIDLSGPACSCITNVSLFHIARRCHKLRYLYISNRNRITSTGIQVIARCCPNMEVLGMSKCPLIRSRGLGIVVHHAMELQKLDISGCVWVTDSTLTEIAQHCNRLTYLNVEGCKRVTDAGIVALANSCKTLRHINLRNTKKISDGGLEQFLMKIPHLEGLEIGLVKKARGTAAMLNLVAAYCRNLTYFDYQEWLMPPVDDIICQIAERCQGLRHLGIRHPNRQTMSSDMVHSLTRLCPSLTKIDATVRFYI